MNGLFPGLLALLFDFLFPLRIWACFIKKINSSHTGTVLSAFNLPCTSHSAYVVTSTKSHGVKIDGFLYPNFMYMDSNKVSEKFLHCPSWVLKNLSIFSWFAGTPGQRTHRPGVWCSKFYLFSQYFFKNCFISGSFPRRQLMIANYRVKKFVRKSQL